MSLSECVESPERKTNRTFALGIEASRVLAVEAKDRRVSTNIVINDLIMKNLRQERGLRALKPISIIPAAIRLLLEEIPDKKIVEVGETVANDVLVRDIPFEVEGCMSPKSVFDMMKLYECVSQNNHEGKKVAILAHYAGMKYSLFIGTFYKTLFANAGSKVEFGFDDNAVVFDLE